MLHRAVHVHPPLRALTLLMSAVLVATLLVVLPQPSARAADYAPASLLTRSLLGRTDSPYLATTAQLDALHALEQQAVQNTLADHGLPPSDAAAAQTWARSDAEAELWALLAQAIRTAPADRSDDQQLAVDWFTDVQHRQDVAAAQNAGMEYAKWAGLGAKNYQNLLATHPTLAQLTAFLSSPPVNYGSGMSPSTPESADNEGYYVYSSPNPVSGQYTANIYTDAGSNTAPTQCYVPCQTVAGCAAPTPSRDEFVEWGLAEANASFQTLSWGQANMATVAGLGYVGAAVGSGAIGAITSTALAETGALVGSTLFAKLQPFLARVAVKAGQAAAGALSEAEVSELAGTIAASEVGFLAGIVLAGIAAAIEIGIKLNQDAQLPGQLAQLALDAPGNTPDLPAMLADPSAATGLFGLFVGATVPDPVFGTCDNLVVGAGIKACLNAPPVPDASVDGPAFTITAEGATTSTTTKSIGWTDQLGQLTGTARIAGHWFVENLTADSDGSSLTRASLQLRYTDWDGNEQTVWLTGNPDVGYQFIRAQIGGSAALDPKTCGSTGMCASTSSIRYVGTDGKHYTATLPPGSGAPTVPTNTFGQPTYTTLAAAPATPQAGRPVTLTATIPNSAPSQINRGSVDFVAVVDRVPTTLCADVTPSGELVPTGPNSFLEASQATCTTTFTDTGPRDVYATYDGSAADAQSSQGVLRVNVGTVAPTTTTITADDADVTLDGAGTAAVTYTVTVADFYPDETAQPDGSVSVDGAGPACQSLPLTGSGTSRTATCTTVYTTSGARAATAVYSGDAHTTGSAGSVGIRVAPGPLTIHVTAPKTVTPGEQFTVGVSLTDERGNPVTGPFDLHGNFATVGSGCTQLEPGARGNAPGSCTLTAFDQEYTISLRVLTENSSLTLTIPVADPITVDVSGSQHYAAAAPTLQLESVSPDRTTFSGQLTCTQVQGDDVPLSSQARPMPTGTYTIDGSTCSGLTAANGAAISYVGVPDGFTVTKAPQTVSFVPVDNPLAGTAGPIFEQTSGTSADTPLAFSVDPSSDPGVCTVDPTGMSAHFLQAGKCVVNLDRAGDANYEPAPTFTRTITVAGARSAVVVSSLQYTDYVGEPFTLHASVTNSAGFTPTGTVTFTKQGSASPLCAADVPAQPPYDVACTMTFNEPGVDYIDIVYSGDDHLATSYAAPAVVMLGRSTTSLTASSLDQKAGDPATYTATVTATGRIVPEGTVEFTDEDGDVLCADAPLGTSAPYQAHCQYAFTESGPHTVTASYGGTSSLTDSADSLTVDVAEPVVLQAIAIAPHTSSTPAGRSVQFTATGHYSDGSHHTLEVAWSSSDATIATIDPASGLAVGLTPGAATITAAAGNVTATASLTVTDPVLTDLDVSPATLRLAKGTTGTLTATGTYSDGTTRDLSTTATWSTSNADVADVSAGLVSAAGRGTATITVTAGAMTATAQVTVTRAVPLSLAIRPAAPTLAKGTSLQLTAVATYTDHSTADVTDSATWTSSAGAVAAFAGDSAGLLTGDRVGTTTVTAVFDGVRRSVTATVSAARLQKLTVEPASARAPLGSTVDFTATGTYSDGHRQDLTDQVHWSATPARVATIDAHGVATTNARGTAHVRATMDGIHGVARLRVTAPVLTGIAVRPARLRLPKGLSALIMVVGAFTDGSVRPIRAGVSLRSSKPSVASVSGLRVTARTKGTALLTATDGSLTATATVRVTAPLVRKLVAP